MKNRKENLQGAQEVRSRRWFLKKTAGVGFGLATALDQFPNWYEELTNTAPATIGLAEGQRLDATTESGVLVLCGVPGRSGKSIANALTPSLGLLGSVMYAKYGGLDEDVKSLKEHLDAIQRKTGMKRLSLYCQSMGFEVAGKLIPLIGDQFEFDYIFADCPPLDFSDVHFGKVGQLLADDPYYNGGAIFTAINDTVVYGNPLEPYVSDDTATPTLYWKEIRTLGDGKRYSTRLINYFNRYNANHERKMKMVVLRPQNPAKDPVVKDIKALKDLRKDIPATIDAPVSGRNQGHANADKNPYWYNRAIRGAIFNLSNATSYS